MFSDQAIANLLALNKSCEKYHVTFDSKVENAFNVKLKDGRIMKFTCDSDGMYSFLPEGSEKKKETQHMEMENNLGDAEGRFKQVHIEELGPKI